MIRVPRISLFLGRSWRDFEENIYVMPAHKIKKKQEQKKQK